MSNEQWRYYDPQFQDPDATLRPDGRPWGTPPQSPDVQNSQTWQPQPAPYSQQPPVGLQSSPYAQFPQDSPAPPSAGPASDPYYPTPFPINPTSGYGQAPGQPPVYRLMAPAAGRPRSSVSFGRAIKLFFKNYSVFSGRASRSEYWFSVLFTTLVILALDLVYYAVTGAGMFYGARLADMDDGTATKGALLALLLFTFMVGTLIPNLAITWRRLHDSGKSGGTFFLSWIPYIGAVVLVIFLLLPSSPSAWQRFDTGRLPAGN
ncbi:DUF805 domain-containing protein [Acidipropionibacterium virtanenii]|uniref:Inner membrane protein YhaI n=1 Tax=Acidipropionibacterium virtanenii TaxID=2057246 RepID=A0A344UXU7_9ACTN|nr:DUF805 domain-containing protein [Acidipropionibacterium virtanenii]AXE40095.1 Inner membrane protein YhaI [Acidipropionibacterium virtanenii]